jgi:serine/threonine protein kinase
MALTPGTRFGRYEIRAQLGAGGMGEVYLADDPALDRQVAIKVLSGDCADGHAVKRLMREAKAAATLEHSNICTIYEVGDANGCPFVVMQRVDGETLAARMSRGALAWDDAMAIGMQVADALAAAHARGIIHRDVKPRNIMITRGGQAKLLDFGLAALMPSFAKGDAETESDLTLPGTIVGTVNYMSPEHAQGQRLDARSDIFSFGVVLYEMVSGRHPFAGDNHAATISAILLLPPEPLARSAVGAPAELDRILTKALAKDPGARYQSIQELLIDLRHLPSQR